MNSVNQTPPASAVPGPDNQGVDLTIVIPCLNEQDNITGILDQVRDLVVAQSFTSEIVVVDDQSDDRTIEYAEQWAKEN